MDIPFTTEQFFEVIINYNTTFFPAQLIIILLGIFSVTLIHSEKKKKDTLIGVFLGILWLWIGIAYHLAFFTEINKAAYLFGGFFIIQGILFFIETFLRKNLEFKFDRGVMEYAAYFFIVFGLIIYPILIYTMENSIDSTITLGLPCPSTIMTFGFLMLTKPSLPKYLLIIPVLWTIIGTSAAFNFGVYPDLVMPLSAITAIVYIFAGKKKAEN